MSLDRKTLERILIVRTMVALDRGHDWISAVEIADRASTECDHDLLEGLPEISRRGIGQKLKAMNRDGLVGFVYDPDQRLRFWRLTDKGRYLAASIDGLRSDLTLTAEECRTLVAWHEVSIGDAPFPARAFAETPAGRVMAKIAAGAEGARS